MNDILNVITTTLARVTYLDTVRGIALLFFLDWFFYLPFFRVAFSRTDENSGFKTRSNVKMLLLASVWLAAIVLLVNENSALRAVGATVLFGIFRRHYINERWHRVRRGFGAPGFMSHWAILYIFVIEITRLIDATGALTHLSFQTLKWDFGWIMICAGSYKILSGYVRSDGMEYGQANPMWGYFWRFFAKQPPTSPISQAQNWLACVVEFSCGILMVIPNATTQVIGAIGISLSFLYVAIFIRLGRLAILMFFLPLFFLPSVEASFTTGTLAIVQAPEAVVFAISGVLWIFMAILPIIKVMQYVNLFLNKKFPAPIQNALGFVAGRLPIIMWRVFTPDVTNFFVRVYSCDASGNQIEALIDEKRYGLTDWKRFKFKLRALHVTESIALTSVFTTLRYFPSDRKMFEDKLWKYGRSLAADWGTHCPIMRFEFVAIMKAPKCFNFVNVGIFDLELETGNVTETKYVTDYSYAAPSRYSPVRESAIPGTYLPKSP